MINIKFTIALILATTLFSIQLYSQKRHIIHADESYKQEQFADAIDCYKKGFSKIKEKNEKARILFQIANCYRMISDSKQAENWYKKVIKNSDAYPISYLYLAEALKANEKYDEAIVEYNNYKNAVPKDPRGAEGAEACSLAQKWIDNPTRYEVTNLKNINSKESDFSPTYSDKKYKSIVFTTTRVGVTGKMVDGWTGQSFSDLFQTQQDKKGAWSVPLPLGENINTGVNEGSASINNSITTMYFTRCDVQKEKQLGCLIMVAKKEGKDWGQPSVVKLNTDSNVTVAHPSISKDELELYYVSDKEGGYGGKDIWVAKRDKKSGEFTKFTNLGPKINTPGDEMFPYIREDGVLFFASNGHNGMGGLDIFKVEKKGKEWGDPENMRYPINSGADDFGIIFEGTKEQGYFSSNRKGGKGSDDLYSFIQIPLVFTMQGVVKDDSSRTPIAKAIVKLVGSDGTVIEDTTDSKGFYSFNKAQILPNTSYELLVSKDKYFSSKGKETTVGLERNKDIVLNFTLKQIPAKPIVLPEILYDLAKWDLKPQYQDSLNGLVQTMTDNPKIVIELASHTDSRATDEYNDTLSQKRAQSVVDYLISKGIDPDRMTAKGYGKKSPRIITKTIISDGFEFKEGTIINDNYISSLKTNEEKEAAHQLNRRTEFKVIRSDFVPKPTNILMNPETPGIVNPNASKDETLKTEEEIKKERQQEIIDLKNKALGLPKDTVNQKSKNK